MNNNSTSSPRRRAITIAALSASLALVAAACGDDTAADEGSDDAAAETTAAPADDDAAAETTAAPAADDDTDDDAAAETTAAPAADDAAAGGDEWDRIDWPDTLTYAIVPAENAENISGYITPDILSDVLDIEFEVQEAADYAGVIEGMIAERVDVGSFGAFSYVIATGNGADIDLAGIWSGDDPDSYGDYRSYLVVPPDSEIAAPLTWLARRCVSSTPVRPRASCSRRQHCSKWASTRTKTRPTSPRCSPAATTPPPWP